MQEKKIDIRYLKGVGPKKAEFLHRAGIATVEDLLYYLPRRYEDRSKFTLIKDLKILQKYYLNHFPEKIREHCLNFQIGKNRVTVPDSIGRFFL